MSGLWKWLVPGLKVKRWLLLALAGLGLLMAGVVIVGNAWLNVSQFFAQFPQSASAGFGFVAAGIVLSWYGFKRVFKSLLEATLPARENSLVELVIQKRQLKRGPKIVVLGGGTGLGVLLRGLKEYTSNITAIVTVSDDGGSSGRLRGELGILPPGDTRNCLLALAETESLMENLFNHRFKEGAGLKGHNVGNLLLAAMNDLTGDFNLAIQELSRVLAIRGQVLPATLTNVTLVAKMASGKVIRGESAITAAGTAIERVTLDPGQVEPLPETLEAIQQADAIVLGPGSLYTSIIPNLLVKGIPQAIASSKAPVFYVCNVMTQPGETTRYTASQHLKAIIDHAGRGVIDYMLVNTQPITAEMLSKYRDQGAHPVPVDEKAIARLGVKLLKADLVNQDDLVRHDADKLARAILKQTFQLKSLGEKLKLLEMYLYPLLWGK